MIIFRRTADFQRGRVIEDLTAGRSLGLFGLRNRVERLDVETFVVGIASDFVDFNAFYEKEARADVGFLISGKPNFVVDEACSSMKLDPF